MDDIFLLFMLIGIGFFLYFFLFKRYFKDAFIALGVSVASFFLFGMALNVEETAIQDTKIEIDSVEEIYLEKHHKDRHENHHSNYLQKQK